jgi:hypothetical protein
MGLHERILALHASLGKNKKGVFGENLRLVDWAAAACGR